MSQRISKRNEINFKIRENEKIIAKNLHTINRIREKDDTYYKNMCEKLKLQNEEREEEIQNFKQIIGKIDTGEYDKEIKEEKIENQRIIKQKNQEVLDRKSKIKDMEDKNNEEWKQKNQKERDYFRKERYNKRNLGKEYQKFLKNVNRCPDFIKKKLKNMPNNKGYVWNNIYYFGQQKQKHKSDTVTIIQKERNNKMYIQEWRSDRIDVYLCISKGKKELMSTRPRKEIKL